MILAVALGCCRLWDAVGRGGGVVVVAVACSGGCAGGVFRFSVGVARLVGELWSDSSSVPFFFPFPFPAAYPRAMAWFEGTVHGVFNSVAGVGGAVTDTVSKLTFDNEYQMKRERTKNKAMADQGGVGQGLMQVRSR